MHLLKNRFKNLPIEKKINLVILVTCGTALAMTAVAIFFVQLVAFRQDTAGDLETIAGIIGQNSTAALISKDAQAARQVLCATRSTPCLLSASIDLADGTRFASYQAGKARRQPVAAQGDGSHFIGRYLLLNHPIMRGRERLGTLHLVLDYQTEYGRSVHLYAAVLSLVSLLSVSLALRLSSRLQRLISAPILRLAETAQRIADTRDYAARAEKTSQDEVGRLTDAFNAMLDKIQRRAAALHEANKAAEAEIAERKRMEAELAYERDLLKTLLDNFPDAIYFKDCQSRFVRYSKSLPQLFHLSDPEMLKGKSDADFFTEEHARPALEDEQEIVRTGKPIIGKIEKETHADGRVTWALTSKLPWRDPQGNLMGTFGISKDITSIKNAEEELEKLHKELVLASRQAGMAEVATGVLHNVGNVLNSVNVSATLIRESLRQSEIASLGKLAALLQSHAADLTGFLTTDPKGKLVPNFIIQLAQHLQEEHARLQKEHEQLVQNVEHVKQIVAMQQNYARVSGVLEKVSLASLVDDALQIHTAGLARHGVQVVRNYSEVPPLVVDKHKALQILVNVVHNAKYALDASAHSDKLLTAGISMNGDRRVKVTIADNGVGIPPENLTRIFSHGFTTRKGGHGFGLHSGANAAKEMGGSLKAHSDGLGKGASFTLELPLEGQKAKS